MKEEHLNISRSARYFTSEVRPEEVKEIWFVCHGYGQLANYFLKWFEPIEDPSRLIVAPEGFHRFYLQGFSGRVGASWMTKEDRLTDIDDYVRYLDQLYDHIMEPYLGEDISIKVLGFSQGTATVCRWLGNGRSRADELILWAGVFPHDMELDPDSRIFQRMRIQMLFGTQDEFRDDDKIREHREILEEKGIPYEFIEFEGKHKVEPEPLKALLKDKDTHQPR